MKLTSFSRIESHEAARQTGKQTADPEDETDPPEPRQATWEPSTWIKAPTKAQLMAGR